MLENVPRRGRRGGDEPENTRVVGQDKELDYLSIMSLSAGHAGPLS